ncbi:multiheme c-type cytochrome [Xanthobacteraceae bacterium Astr-EGSB]|uniref:multiheme c-type cytochrome n=1 Tax=Astrobacterium formosum TaxID=3069710 RepID=UPI0027AF85BB|nr:multiheme c-type cytochrome [Xanthobacteraceae bacterium Astr-EGSB]
MKISRKTAFAGRHGLFVLAMAAGLAGWLVSAKAQDTALSDPDKACLGCHGMEGMDKKAANGDSIPLHVPADIFAKSVHTAVGCTGCHYDIKADAHPATPKNITSARAFSVETVQTCRNCHDDKFKEWENSIHASLVRDGNPAAPICSDCHSPHGVIKNAASAMESVPCRGCHSDVYEAYAGSVHGKLRESGQIMAPLCAGCHTAHSITAANVAMELGLKSICTGCHADTFEKHKTWLPNAGLHLETVSCAACHAPGVPRQVNLRLVDQATQKRIAEQSGVPRFEAAARANDGRGTGLGPVEVWTLLRSLERDKPGDQTVLLGRLEVQKGADAHKLAAKGKAVSDCGTCHRQGAEAFQTVSLSVARPDGRLIRYGAQSDVLSSIVSVDSIKGFYAIGATRIDLVDYLVILALVGGAAIPVGHLLLGWFVRRANRRGAAKA